MLNLARVGALVTLAVFVAAQAEYVVVVNKASSAVSISKVDLKRIYTGQLRTFAKVKAVPVNRQLDSDIAKEFLKNVVGMTPDEYKQYWVAEQIKGAGTAPMIQKSDAGVQGVVSQVPGGIGYVAKTEVDSTVKVITVEDSK